MNEAFWHGCTRPDRMWPVVATTATERKLRLAICAGHPVGLLRELGLDTEPPEPDWESRLVRLAEDFADTGTVTDEFTRMRTAYCEAVLRFESQEGFGGRDGDLYQSARLSRLVFGMTHDFEAGVRTEEFRRQWDVDDAPACGHLRDIFGNPFRPVPFAPEWRTSTAVAIARSIHDGRAFDRMPILVDALQDAGCTNAEIINHCRNGGPHVRGCWVLDLVLEKK